MILKVQLNQKIDTELNWSLSTEVVIDNSEEGEAAGEEFMLRMDAFRRGMLAADLESEQPPE